jgi:hypothetical protein
MKTLELRELEVEPIPTSELQTTEGGLLLNLPSVVGRALKFVAGEIVDFSEGFANGIAPIFK